MELAPHGVSSLAKSGDPPTEFTNPQRSVMPFFSVPIDRRHRVLCRKRARSLSLVIADCA
jgi:hypothetical protein